jgi:choline-glycine betaine transporter
MEVWGDREMEHWGIHSWRFYSLLDMAFLFCCGASMWLSMPIFSWFVEQLMRNGMVKMALLGEIH